MQALQEAGIPLAAADTSVSRIEAARMLLPRQPSAEITRLARLRKEAGRFFAKKFCTFSKFVLP